MRTRPLLPGLLALVACAVALVIGACNQSESRSTTHSAPSRQGFEDPGHSPRRSVPAHGQRSKKYAAPDYSKAEWRERELRAEARALDMQMSMFPGSRPPLDEEIWVIQKPEVWDAQDAGERPGCGALGAFVEGDLEPEFVPLPLRHTEVDARIGGTIASTAVTQRFHNPFDSTIEAVYVFPLPQNAAVNEFVMVIGERRIRGIVREREEAERLYEEARGAGYVASLLLQERPNVFRQNVANIEPGRRIDIEITYFHSLPYRDGNIEYVFPMVVGPRFNPPHAADGIGAVARGDRGASGQSTEVQYLAPDERSGHDVSVRVAIDAGIEIGAIRSKHHAIEVFRDSITRADVRLAREEEIPNRDFVLRFEVADEGLRSGLLARLDPRTGEGYFSMLILPPTDLASLPRHPMEIVFLLDASGSMSGAPIDQAKDAVTQALAMLEPTDTFQIIRFSDRASPLGSAPLPATRDNVRDAQRHVRAISASGGTMMRHGIDAALGFPADPRRRRFVCFMTDGYIGNEMEILDALHAGLGDARVFSFGVGSSPNRYLMERVAKLGRGAVAYVSLDDDGAAVMAKFFERAAHPALTDLTIDWAGMPVDGVYPAALPDVYAGRAIQLFGRFRGGELPERVTLSGRVGGRRRTVQVPVRLAREGGGDDRLARAMRAVWARTQIADLLDEATREPIADLSHRVRDLALRHGLMSPFTGFIAVDATRRTDGTHGTTVPVPVPDGVNYSTTVTGSRADETDGAPPGG